VVLGIHRGGPAEIIVAALDVQADEEDVARDPAQVLPVLHVAPRLPLQFDLALAETVDTRLEQPADRLRRSIRSNPVRWQSTQSLSLGMMTKG
jgi:hypothetical protein